MALVVFSPLNRRAWHQSDPLGWFYRQLCRGQQGGEVTHTMNSQRLVCSDLTDVRSSVLLSPLGLMSLQWHVSGRGTKTQNTLVDFWVFSAVVFNHIYLPEKYKWKECLTAKLFQIVPYSFSLWLCRRPRLDPDSVVLTSRLQRLNP